MFRRSSSSNQPTRPYQSFRIEDLNITTTLAWNSISSLQEILQELTHRTTKRAMDLRSRVQGRIAELNGSTRTTNDALFAEIGLHPSAPDFVIQAVLKAYRNNSRSSRSPEAFRKIEQIFNEIHRQ